MNTPKVTQLHADHLQDYLDEYGITIKNKVRDKPDNWLHAIVLWLGSLFVKHFNTLFATTIGSTIYLQRSKPKDLTNYYTYMMVRHELVHAIDYQRFHIWFLFSYALVLPALLTMRSFWEKRGYTQNVLVKHELGEEIDDGEEVERMVGRFTGRAYFWMEYDEDKVRRYWLKAIDDIENGKITGYYPYDEEHKPLTTILRR
jgi:hypothetical protein